VLITLVRMAGDVVVDLGLQRLGQHPPRALPDELVDQSRAAVPTRLVGSASLGNYGAHGSYPSDRRCSADLA
jgi:hypothetical protein